MTAADSRLPGAVAMAVQMVARAVARVGHGDGLGHETRSLGLNA